MDVLRLQSCHHLHHRMGKLQLPPSGGQVLPCLRLRQAIDSQIQCLSVRAQAVALLHGTQDQRLSGQLRPGLGAVGTQGVVVLQRTVLVAYRGSQAHDALQQPNLIIRILGQCGKQKTHQLVLRVCLSHLAPLGSRQGDVLVVVHRPGVHQPPRKELVHGEHIAVTPRRLPVQHPPEEFPPIPRLSAVFITGLTVQRRPVVISLRHTQGITQGLRQIYYPLHIVWSVVQGHIGDLRPVRLGHLVVPGLRPHRAAAAQHQAGHGQCQHSSHHVRSPHFQKSGAHGPAPFLFFTASA